MQLEYGNWVRKKKLLILGFCTFGAGAMVAVPLGLAFRIMATALFIILLISFFLPLYSYIMFSQNGGKYQEKIYDLAIQHLGKELNGKYLDIGSGNGVLTVLLAMKHERINVTGIDYWGKDWEYSKSVCEKNARMAHVENRVHFQKGDAASLDFTDRSFDGAISNLTFHEVKAVADKRTVLQEALRVVKPGGTFAFIDYFFEEKYYGNKIDFEKYLEAMNCVNLEFKHLRELIKIPRIMEHPKILGKVGIIFGKK
jgi:ubiquinone/menaquinone biosynthesis C-methylase UbiE